MVCLSGRISSVATISSPSGLTCWSGATGSVIKIDVSFSSITFSIITTALKLSGIGSPVSTQTALEPIMSFKGFVSLAPMVSSDLTATPSIAEES